MNNVGGCIVLLKLPASTAFSMDGSEAKILRKYEELLVFGHLPAGLHLLTIRAAATNTRSNQKDEGNAIDYSNSGNSSTMSLQTIGLMVYVPEKEPSDFFLVRTFDPVTEELSSKHDMDEITIANLKTAIQNQNEHIDSSKLIHYQSIITQGRESVWKQHLTNFIDQSVLRNYRLTGNGDKIIPGAYSSDNHDIDITLNSHSKNSSSPESIDGITLIYDPIPCIDAKCRFHAHNGTKRYLANLSPSQRTELLTLDDPKVQGGIVFERILQEYYHNRYEELLGSMQLSFICFLCCSCLSSLEHWRDIIYMMSLVDVSTIQRYRTAFEFILTTICHQFSSFGNEMLQEDVMEWQELIHAMRRLCQNCSTCAQEQSSLNTCSQNLMNQINQIFGHDTGYLHNDLDSNDDSDHDEEDSPIIVPLEEIEEAMNRPTTKYQVTPDASTYAKKYPFLFASLCPGEDVLMACARILDERNDVTLVREAAHYLDNVESKK